MIHDIIIRKQDIYENKAFSRLALVTHFALHCHECCEAENEYGEEL